MISRNGEMTSAFGEVEGRHASNDAGTVIALMTAERKGCTGEVAAQNQRRHDMQQISWTRYLVAAALVLAFGVIWAVAGDEMKIEVRNAGGEEITIDVNGETEVISLDDLADGESREYEVGGRPFTVHRHGDELKLDHGDGGHHGLFVMSGGGDPEKVWVMKGDHGDHGERRVMIVKEVEGDGKEITVDVLTDDVHGDHDAVFIGEDLHGEHEVIIMKGDEGELDIEALKEKYGDDFEEFTTEDGKKVVKWVKAGDGAHPIMIQKMRHGMDDMAVFRCDETGSMLTVKDDGNLLESYLDPVTGCVMEKIDGQAGVRVITIHEEIEVEDED
jgi:hypothetical protein